ncbi:MAG TPA: calcium-binding protein, partial [Rhodocyclaceae bacterium]|nr:calcium-binding protein [Rhodocyclaceae bacterium]
MSVLTKTGVNSVLGTPAADQILVSNPDDALAGLIDGSGGIDELRFTSTSAEYLIFGANIGNVESVVIGTGNAVAAVTTGTTAEAVDASMALNALAITGNAGANEIVGTAYADTINGGKGNDVLYGGDGNDTFLVAAAVDHGSNEVIDGEDGYDTLLFAGTTAGDTLTLSAYTDVEAVALSPSSGTTALHINAQEVMNGTGLAITGNAGANVLTGTFWGDVLSGGAGNDTLNGGIGDDRFMIGALAEYGSSESINGGLGSDTIIFAGAAGQTLVLNSGTTAVEQVLLRNPAAPEAAANLDAHNVAAGAGGAGLSLVGNNGANVLTGSAGRDSLAGFGGNDVFLVTAVSQVPVGETISGGDGTDEIRFALASGGETLTLEGRVVDSVERIVIGTGTAPAAILTGTAALNIDATGVVLDLIYAGNAGPNNIQDDAGNSLMEGGGGNDTLQGGDGNDTLVGGAGNDILSGGAGDNLFLYRDAAEAGPGEVIVTAGGTNVLRFVGASGVLQVPLYDTQEIHFIDLPGATPTSPVGVNAAAWSGGALIVGNGGANAITGTSANDTIVGGAGADSMAGGPGHDLFQVASAAHATGDTYVGGTGFDTVLLGTAGAYAFSAATAGIERISWAAPLNAAAGANVNAAAVTTGLVLEGTAGANVLTAGAGNDTIVGGDGADS